MNNKQRLFNQYGNDNTLRVCPELVGILRDMCKKIKECGIEHDLDMRDVENVAYAYISDEILEHVISERDKILYPNETTF